MASMGRRNRTPVSPGQVGDTNPVWAGHYTTHSLPVQLGLHFFFLNFSVPNNGIFYPFHLVIYLINSHFASS